MSGQMKAITKYVYKVEEAEITVECPWYADEVVHEVLISENCIVLGVLTVDYSTENPRECYPNACDEKMYQQWRDNDIWGYGVWVYDTSGKLICCDDECWGFYGAGYARTELKDAFDRAVEGRRRLCKRH